jgi:FKBP-type peptidyl-prolyl cis-trans isomerase SlyD
MTDQQKSIADDAVVTFHYKLSDAEGSVTESSEPASPVVYMHGHNNIVPGLETEMTGKKSGDKFTATVAPDKGYGERNPNAIQRVPVKHLATKGPYAAGQMVAVQTRDGLRQAQVVKVGHFNVDLDLNHPLAGKTLTFEIEVVGVRDATAEELAHGHAHGPEGHGHHHDHDHADHEHHDH